MKHVWKHLETPVLRFVFLPYYHFFHPDTHTQVRLSVGKKCSFFGKIGVLCSLKHQLWDSPFWLITEELAISSWFIMRNKSHKFLFVDLVCLNKLIRSVVWTQGNVHTQISILTQFRFTGKFILYRLWTKYGVNGLNLNHSYFVGVCRLLFSFTTWRSIQDIKLRRGYKWSNLTSNSSWCCLDAYFFCNHSFLISFLHLFKLSSSRTLE